MKSLHKKLTHKIRNGLRNHARSFCFALGQIKQKPLGNTLTILAIAVALALPFGLFTLVTNIQALGGYSSPSITVYLKKISPQQLNQFQQKISQLQPGTKINYISPESGLNELAHYTNMKRLFSQLKHNPLPGVLVITPRLNSKISTIQLLATQLRAYPQSERVQINMTWVRRLHYITHFGQRLSLALSIVFCLAVVLIIANTIRLITQRHQEEIHIMRLFGATPHFIRQPLLYRGTLLGFIGGLLAWILVSLILYWLVAPLQSLALSYQQPLSGMGFSLKGGLILTLISTGLAFLGSWFAVKPYLSMPEE